jgi:DNA-binding XRE family transcriptional regulator
MSWSSIESEGSFVGTRLEAAMQIDPTKLVEARMARAMSQEEAAIAADLSTRTIQRIEAGLPASLESTKALLTIFGAEIIHDPEAKALSVHASPWALVAAQVARASRRSAGLGFDGLRLLFAANFLLVGAAKPFLPDRTGMFVGGDVKAIGLLARQPLGSQEVLGYWIMPLMAVAAVALLMSIGRIRSAAVRLVRLHSRV